MLTNFDWANAVTSSPIFLVLIGCSVVTLAIAIERAHYFWKRQGNAEETTKQALNKIDAGRPQEAKWACETSRHPLGAVALEVMKHAHRSIELVEERMQIALSGQKLLLERNLNVLGTMAAVAPLIGLLGTVWGIMRAFNDMAATGSAAPSVVAAGVAEALVTTAAGLIVAVPAVMLYNHFSQRMNVMLTEAENHSRTLRAALVEGPANTDGTPNDRPAGGGRAQQKTQATTATPEPVATS